MPTITTASLYTTGELKNQVVASTQLEEYTWLKKSAGRKCTEK
jgi:hypothetical protein